MRRRPVIRKRKNYIGECIRPKFLKRRKSKRSRLMREGYMDDAWYGKNRKRDASFDYDDEYRDDDDYRYDDEDPETVDMDRTRLFDPSYDDSTEDPTDDEKFDDFGSSLNVYGLNPDGTRSYDPADTSADDDLYYRLGYRKDPETGEWLEKEEYEKRLKKLNKKKDNDTDNDTNDKDSDEEEDKKNHKDAYQQVADIAKQVGGIKGLDKQIAKAIAKQQQNQTKSDITTPQKQKEPHIQVQRLKQKDIVFPEFKTRLRDIYNSDSSIRKESYENAILAYLSLFNELIQYPKFSGVSNPKIKSIADLDFNSQDFKAHVNEVTKYIVSGLNVYMRAVSSGMQDYMNDESRRSGRKIRLYKNVKEIDQTYKDKTFDSLILLSPCLFDYGLENSITFKNCALSNRLTLNRFLSKEITQTETIKNVQAVACLKYLSSTLPYVTPNSREQIIQQLTNEVPTGEMSWSFGLSVIHSTHKTSNKNRNTVFNYMSRIIQYGDAWRMKYKDNQYGKASNTDFDDKIDMVMKRLILDQKFMTVSDIATVAKTMKITPNALKQDYINAQKLVAKNKPLIQIRNGSTPIG